jgi:hypothetical protein
VILLVAVTGCRHGQHTPQPAATSPYADETDRAVKALPPDRIDGLLTGEGLGYAMAAELNGYPGPRHVIDLADSLHLSPEQLGLVRDRFARMQDSAVVLGNEIVLLEKKLDAVFAGGNATEIDIRTLTNDIGRIEGRLRSIHLSAHIETAEILTDSQIATYNRLRGYDGDSDRGTGHDQGHSRTHGG